MESAKVIQSQVNAGRKCSNDVNTNKEHLSNTDNSDNKKKSTNKNENVCSHDNERQEKDLKFTNDVKTDETKKCEGNSDTSALMKLAEVACNTTDSRPESGNDLNEECENVTSDVCTNQRHSSEEASQQKIAKTLSYIKESVKSTDDSLEIFAEVHPAPGDMEARDKNRDKDIKREKNSAEESFQDSEMANTGDVRSQDSQMANTGDVRSQDSEVANTGDARSQDSQMANTGDVRSQDSQMANTGDVRSQDSEMANTGDVRSQDSEMANTGDVRSQDSEMANTGDVRSQDSEMANTGDVRSQDSEMANTGDVRSQDSEMANTGDVRSQDSEMANTEDVRSQDSEMANTENVRSQDSEMASIGDVGSPRQNIESTDNEQSANKCMKDNNESDLYKDEVKISSQSSVSNSVEHLEIAPLVENLEKNDESQSKSGCEGKDDSDEIFNEETSDHSHVSKIDKNRKASNRSENFYDDPKVDKLAAQENVNTLLLSPSVENKNANENYSENPVENLTEKDEDFTLTAETFKGNISCPEVSNASHICSTGYDVSELGSSKDHATKSPEETDGKSTLFGEQEETLKQKGSPKNLQITAPAKDFRENAPFFENLKENKEYSLVHGAKEVPAHSEECFSDSSLPDESLTHACQDVVSETFLSESSNHIPPLLMKENESLETSESENAEKSEEKQNFPSIAKEINIGNEASDQTFVKNNAETCSFSSSHVETSRIDNIEPTDDQNSLCTLQEDSSSDVASNKTIPNVSAEIDEEKRNAETESLDKNLAKNYTKETFYQNIPSHEDFNVENKSPENYLGGDESETILNTEKEGQALVRNENEKTSNEISGTGQEASGKSSMRSETEETLEQGNDFPKVAEDNNITEFNSSEKTSTDDKGVANQRSNFSVVVGYSIVENEASEKDIRSETTETLIENATAEEVISDIALTRKECVKMSDDILDITKEGSDKTTETMKNDTADTSNQRSSVSTVDEDLIAGNEVSQRSIGGNKNAESLNETLNLEDETSEKYLPRKECVETSKEVLGVDSEASDKTFPRKETAETSNRRSSSSTEDSIIENEVSQKTSVNNENTETSSQNSNVQNKVTEKIFVRNESVNIFDSNLDVECETSDKNSTINETTEASVGSSNCIAGDNSNKEKETSDKSFKPDDTKIVDVENISVSDRSVMSSAENDNAKKSSEENSSDLPINVHSHEEGRETDGSKEVCKDPTNDGKDSLKSGDSPNRVLENQCRPKPEEESQTDCSKASPKYSNKSEPVKSVESHSKITSGKIFVRKDLTGDFSLTEDCQAITCHSSLYKNEVEKDVYDNESCSQSLLRLSRKRPLPGSTEELPTPKRMPKNGTGIGKVSDESDMDDEDKLIIDEDRGHPSSSNRKLLKRQSVKRSSVDPNSAANGEKTMKNEQSSKLTVYFSNAECLSTHAKTPEDKTGRGDSLNALISSKDDVCNKCKEIWSDNTLKMLFEGNESVTINSRITYGAIICMNIYVAIHYPNFKEKALRGLLDRADLAKNLGSIKVSILNNWLVALIKNKKISCCSPFRPIYRVKSHSSKLSNKEHAKDGSSQREVCDEEESTLNSSKSTSSNSSEAKRQSKKQQQNSVPEIIIDDEEENNNNQITTRDTSGRNKISSRSSSVTSSLDSNEATTQDSSHTSSVEMKAGPVGSGNKLVITNGNVYHQLTTKHNPVLHSIVLKERETLDASLHPLYDNLVCEPKITEAEAKYGKRKFLTNKELLNIHSVGILNSKEIDLDNYFKLFLQILHHREYTVFIPDDKTLVKHVENLRREDNRHKWSVGKTKQFRYSPWDSEALYSSSWSSNLEKCRTGYPNIREILTVFCLWKNSRFLKKQNEINLITEISSLFDKVTINDCLGLCVRLYSTYCHLMFGEKEKDITKTKLFLSLFYLPKKEQNLQKNKITFSLMSFPFQGQKNLSSIISYLEEQIQEEAHQKAKRSLPEGIIDCKLDQTKKLKADLLISVKNPNMTGLLSTYGRLKNEMSFLEEQKTLSLASSDSPLVLFAEQTASYTPEMRLMVAKLRAANVPIEVIPSVIEKVFKNILKRKAPSSSSSSPY